MAKFLLAYPPVSFNLPYKSIKWLFEHSLFKLVTPGSIGLNFFGNQDPSPACSLRFQHGLSSVLLFYSKELALVQHFRASVGLNKRVKRLESSLLGLHLLCRLR